MAKLKTMCLLLVLALMPAVWSGQISPYLADYLQGMAASEDVEVIVMLSEQADIQSLNYQLKRERATLAERNKRVIEALQDVATSTQPAVAAYLDQLKSRGLVQEYKMMWIANMFFVTANRAGIDAIANMPQVADLDYNYIIEGEKPVEENSSDPPLIAAHEIGLDRINAPAAWALGFTGAGRVVANMDTGVDGTHPALTARFRGDVDGDGDVDESWFDPYSTHWPYPQDSGSHGTHTLGTICGRTESGSDTIGVAIDAQWIAAAPIDRGGGIPGTVQDAIESFEWFVNPDNDPSTQDNPDAVGNSWGISPIYHGYPHCDQTFWIVIDNLEAAGTAVVFSAGNEGSYGANSLRTPADRETTPYNCFSVGSVNGNNTNLPISSFSSRGPTYCTPSGIEAFKPEVVAPGEDVRSSIPGGSYALYDGTSMASPHITGAIGVIRQANPDLDVESIKEILISTAVDLGPVGEDNTYGNGIIDLYEACLVAMSGYGFIEGYVYDEGSNPINGALVIIDGTIRLTHSNDQGYYQIGVPADTSYTLIASFFGHMPDTAVVATYPDTTVSQNFVLNYAPYGVLTGQVTDLDMNPIENAIITVAGTPLSPAYTNEHGYYTFDNIPGGNTYDIEATAVGYGFASGNVFVPVNDTAVLNFALQQLESFEASDGGWQGSGVWEWGVPTSGPNAAYDGNKVWATVLAGNYPSDVDDNLLTPYYLITTPDASLSFFQWFNMESNYDGGNLHVSTDGVNWTLLYPEGTGYPDPDVVGLDQEPGFNGESGGWVQAVFDLSAYQDQSIMFKFRFGTDGSVVRAGWYIDGVVVSGGIPSLPCADMSHESMRAYCEAGDSTSLPMTIGNTGNADLLYSIAAQTDAFASAGGISGYTVNKSMAQESEAEANGQIDESELKKLPDPPFNHGFITDAGGPDDFGYTFKDSEEPDGPVYEWVDISAIGTPVAWSNGTVDDGYTDPIPMGIGFEFYGVVYNSIVISTNGWLSFLPQTNSHLYNENIPDESTPNAIIAVEWDDMDGGTEGQVYYYYDTQNNLFIVSWVDWPYYQYPDGTAPHDFQAILDANDNSITLQYGEIDGDYQADATIGIESETGMVGLGYAYNNSTVTTGMAIKFKYPIFWLTVYPHNGAVAPGETDQVNVKFNAMELVDGNYTGCLIVTCNDPLHPVIEIPCSLTVGPVSVDEFVNVPAAFSLAQNYPNPFNPKTVMAFGLPVTGQTTLEVYDIMGRKVKTLVDGVLPAGTHNVVWDGTDNHGTSVASGIYFYKLAHGEKVITRKMMMLK
jgi:subtilisin family serine protease